MHFMPNKVFIHLVVLAAHRRPVCAHPRHALIPGRASSKEVQEAAKENGHKGSGFPVQRFRARVDSQCEGC